MSQTRSLITYLRKCSPQHSRTRNTRKTAGLCLHQNMLEPQVCSILYFHPDVVQEQKNETRTDTHQNPNRYAHAINIAQSLSKVKKIRSRGIGKMPWERMIQRQHYHLLVPSVGIVSARGALHAKHPPRQKASTSPPALMRERYTINSSLLR